MQQQRRRPLILHTVCKRWLCYGAMATGLTLLPLTWHEASQAQNLPTLGDTSREDLSPLAERKLGEQIMSIVRRDPDYLGDPVINEYLNRLGLSMLDAHPTARGEANFNFEFFAVRDPVLNAFAFPGGFIGFHTGLLLAAQSESELASVMGHEIGHVEQRHIARMLTSQKQDSWISLAALAVAVLAARSSPDAAMAVATGGQGLAMQKQLNFSRDAEREADRIGYQIMKDAGFDPNGMVSFFGRLQNSMRNYSDNMPAFLRSHPLTHERIADIQGRVLNQSFKQRQDSLEFALIKARSRVLQDSTIQGLMDAKKFFEQQAKSERNDEQIAAGYGLAFVAFKQEDFATARKLLDENQKAVAKTMRYRKDLSLSIAYAHFSISLRLAAKQSELALKEAEQALQDYPISRGIANQYAEVLLAAKRADKAADFLRDQLQLYRQEAELHNLLAKVYAEQGKEAMQHFELGEAFALQANWAAAVQQLEIARRAKDAQYYELAQIDAREREWKEKLKEEKDAEKKRR